MLSAGVVSMVQSLLRTISTFLLRASTVAWVLEALAGIDTRPHAVAQFQIVMMNTVPFVGSATPTDDVLALCAASHVEKGSWALHNGMVPVGTQASTADEIVAWSCLRPPVMVAGQVEPTDAMLVMGNASPDTPAIILAALEMDTESIGISAALEVAERSAHANSSGTPSILRPGKNKAISTG